MRIWVQAQISSYNVYMAKCIILVFLPEIMDDILASGRLIFGATHFSNTSEKMRGRPFLRSRQFSEWMKTDPLRSTTQASLFSMYTTALKFSFFYFHTMSQICPERHDTRQTYLSRDHRNTVWSSRFAAHLFEFITDFMRRQREVLSNVGNWMPGSMERFVLICWSVLSAPLFPFPQFTNGNEALPAGCSFVRKEAPAVHSTRHWQKWERHVRWN